MILMPYGKAFFRLSLKLLRKHIPVARRGKPKVSHGKTLLLQGRRVKNAHRGCPTGWAASQTKMTPGMFLFSSGPFGRCLLTENLSLTGSKSLQVSIRRDREQSSIHRLAERIAPRLAGTPTQWQWFPRTQIASELCGTHCHQAGGRDLHGHATARRSSEYGHSTGLHSCLWGQCTSPPRARSHPRSSYTRGRSVQPDQSERGPEIAVAYWRNNNAEAFARDGLEHTRLPWPPVILVLRKCLPRGMDDLIGTLSIACVCRPSRCPLHMRLHTPLMRYHRFDGALGVLMMIHVHVHFLYSGLSFD